jgi:gamma-carbonic anhydrase
MIYPYKGKYPIIHPTALIAEHSTILGDVVIGEDASVWFGAVIRGDVNSIRIGARTNIQDNSMLHVTWDQFALNIGADVTIGHSAVLHGCTILDCALIGMGAIILDGAVVQSESLVGAGSLVRQGFVVPEGMLVGGVPARVLRPLTSAEREGIRESAEHYVMYKAEYRKHRDLDRGLDVASFMRAQSEGKL